MRKNYFFLTFTILIFSLNAQTTAIPDVNFEQELINLGIDNSDTMGFTDGIIVNSDVNTLTTLSLSNSAITDLSGIEAFLAIQSISINELDNLTSIDLSNNSNLTVATLDAAILTDISLPVGIEHFILYNTVITELDLRSYTNLLSITYRNSILDTLILGPTIEVVNVFNNNLSYVNFSDCPNLKNVNISNNNFEALNFSANSALEELRAGGNSLKILDLSNNPNLIDLRIANNNLEYLDVKNMNNANTTILNTVGNPDLICIQVDDPTAAIAGNGNYAGWTTDSSSNYSDNCNYQVYMPDDIFEIYVINTYGDTNVVDDYVSYDKVKNIQSLILPNNIADVTGIEAFMSINYFEISYADPSLLSIDLSKNLSLDTFGSYYNPGFSYTLPKNIEAIGIINSPVTSIDLTGLGLYKLENIVIYSTPLTSITLPITMRFIEIYEADISSFDTSNFPRLERFTLGLGINNSLTTLDVSNNLLLTRLILPDNQLTSLDISQNSSLTELDISNNQLTSLNAKNGNNVNMTTMNAIGNPNLPCINVDNETDATNGSGNYLNWQKPAATLYSENCAALSVEEIEDINTFSIYPNPSKNQFQIETNQTIDKVNIYNIQGKLVKTYNSDQSNYNISSLDSGLYILNVVSNGKIQTHKLIKN
jgi:Leucine-rich repeat (LRR) protein